MTQTSLYQWKTKTLAAEDEAPQYSRSQRRLVGLLGSCRFWLFKMDKRAFPEARDASSDLLSRSGVLTRMGQGSNESHHVVLIMINDNTLVICTTFISQINGFHFDRYILFNAYSISIHSRIPHTTQKLIENN
jgi:hypothetical protein